MTGNQTQFSWLDYSIFTAMLAISVGIGLYHGYTSRKSNSMETYFLGDRKLKLVPVMLSMTVSVVSGNTILGCPAEIYMFGINYVFIGIAFAAGAAIVAYWFVPILHPLMLTSVHEYLELRFKSRYVRLLGTALMFINQTLYVGTVIFGPAIALETATGIPPWGSILMVAVLGTIYTALGGMKGVVWTDVFQAVVMVGGMLIIIIVGTMRVGGWDQVWNIDNKWGRLNVNFDIDPTERMTLWAASLGLLFTGVTQYGVSQPCVQRFCAMPTTKQGQLSMLLNGPCFALMTILAAAAGLVVFAYYAKLECDPLTAGLVGNANQLLPLFIMDVLVIPGLPGVFMMCLFSAALSTLSSSVNSMAAFIWEDTLKDHFAHLSDSRKIMFTKVLVVILGMVCMAVAFLVWIVGGNLVQICNSFQGAVTGPFLGLYLLGMMVPWANWKGTLAGGIIGFSMNLFVMIGQTMSKTFSVSLDSPSSGCLHQHSLNSSTPSLFLETTTSFVNSTTATIASPSEGNTGTHPIWLFAVSFCWYGLGGIIVTMTTGILISLATGPTDPSTVDSRLFFKCLQGRFGTDSAVAHEPTKTKKTLGEVSYSKVRPVDSSSQGEDTAM